MHHHTSARRGALLAINLLFLMVWGFAAFSKVRQGLPAWFPTKFGPTLLGTFPGVTATFWLLAAAEVLAFALAAVALARTEFLERRPTVLLTWTVTASLFVFVMLGFGQWLTLEFNGAFQQFMYFGVTLVALNVANQPAVLHPAESAS